MAFKPVKPREYGSTEDLVSRLIAEGGGVKSVAHLTHRSPTQVYSWSDPQTPDNMPLDAARLITKATGAIAAAEDFASLAGGVFTPIELCAESVPELLAAEAAGQGKLMARVVKFAGMHDSGKLSASDRGVTLKFIDQLVRELVAVGGKLRGTGDAQQ